jgi:hypothetical protein
MTRPLVPNKETIEAMKAAERGEVTTVGHPRKLLKSLKRRVSRLHSKDPADAAWRAQQAQVDADIEGLARDAEADRLVAEMDAMGVEPREQIKRLIRYFKTRKGQP